MITKGSVYKFLDNSGLHPEFDDCGGISFKYQMYAMSCYGGADEDFYFQITLPSKFTCEDYTHTQVLDALMKTMGFVKYVKIFFSEGLLWFTLELFVNESIEVDVLMPKMLDSIMYSRRVFAEILQYGRIL